LIDYGLTCANVIGKTRAFYIFQAVQRGGKLSLLDNHLMTGRLPKSSEMRIQALQTLLPPLVSRGLK
jgi:hypothetical protein